MSKVKIGQVWKFIKFLNPRFDNLKFLIVAHTIGNVFHKGKSHSEPGWKIRTMDSEEYWLTDLHLSNDAVLLEDIS